MKQTKKHTFRFIFICLVFLITGCKNYYNDTIEWMDNLEPETDIEIVKENRTNNKL